MGQKMYANILTIAGSDSGGGAGIQADLKAISATGAYGLSVITALTAQNTVGVDAIYPVAIDFLKQQMQTVARDIHIDAVKIGMLGTPIEWSGSLLEDMDKSSSYVQKRHVCRCRH